MLTEIKFENYQNELLYSLAIEIQNILLRQFYKLFEIIIIHCFNEMMIKTKLQLKSIKLNILETALLTIKTLLLI